MDDLPGERGNLGTTWCVARHSLVLLQSGFMDQVLRVLHTHPQRGRYLESSAKQEVFKLRRRGQAIRESSRQHHCRRYDVSIGVSLSSLLLP